MKATINLDKYESEMVKKAYDVRSAIDGFWHDMKRAKSGVDGMDQMNLDEKTLQYVLDVLEFQLDEYKVEHLFCESEEGFEMWAKEKSK